MAHSVEMPELGESVTEGTITTWLKEVGDTVEVDEPLLEVSTDKVDTEIPSPVAGVILEIKADEDDTVEIGDVIAIIGDEGEEADSSSNESDKEDDKADEAEAEAEDAKEEAPKQEEKKPAKKATGDATDVEMPELGESVTEGTITTWLKEVGDEVEVDEPLLEVSTDKVDTEIPSPVAGTLIEILAEEDDTVEVGDVIARIGDADAAASSDDADDDGSSEDNVADEDEKVTEENSAEGEGDNPEDAPTKDDKKSSSKNKKGSGEGTKVEMPELGESVTEGTITTWLKSVGDMVEVDEPLLEVSTDKVDTEIPSPVEGTILEILAEEDDTVEVGDVIVIIGDAEAVAEADDADDEAEAEAEEKTEEKAEKQTEEKAEKPAPKKSEPKKEAKSEDKADAKNASAKVNNGDNVPYVTPLVRKLADKHGVDLNTIEGTGVGGRIRKQDVLAAAEGGKAEGTAAASSAATKEQADAPKGARANWSTKSVDPAKAELIGTTQRVNRIREITAAKMVESLQTSAQLTHVQEVDVTRVAELRKKVKPAFVEKHGANITYLAFFIKATAEALVSHPNVNASYNADAKEITYHEDVNIGIAVDTPQGLLVPVIKKVQDMNLADIAKAITDLADRARNKKLRPDDLSGATFTVTNIGSEGALLDTPVLTPPQAGILGTAAIEKRPVIVTEDGIDSIAIRQMCYLPFTYDHQLIDGADAGRFVTTIKDRIEQGDFEADLDV
ncbi:2-oxoglutarate dehydrogenase, E2 component, dihydrolipoamide succinyltransferase [Corynebacterium sp. zg912]|uniref:Dihydrolipoamide acetyltransferase component of pyruvate dehydrogenase complex n=1 Tax=Corynebacterium wankanglinii TaxID=2735136 RepID=A0A7H0K965_9CORY|nr:MULTISPECIES: 2-oxoglutarate dehydrogenase, E2 component, dihydrolipoamide succinyltransferase [Corynebacterium]MBA1837292.1 2-oxoglutarate dehydrogenase, E2 component, dihydrolipoamide succinyltransferase [Corynebacterium wankanglinii]MCR5928267.1 2-oxoglutarate dehydrogenase, E2 component, dihydrolipoamide succinyltransferase [Corynebacterium sp. zg912]QNP93831.1 2-oxoglutarate dehydrogenase, E2 component, dihydrolipoamide succinyltransferase [Corynebacterium wankanglinii]